MSLQNETSFVPATMYWEDLQGKPRLSVILKLTLSIEHGSVAKVAEDQIPIFTADVPWDQEAPDSSLKFESDMVPIKPRADVVVVGKAHAPRQEQDAIQCDVTLRVGALSKTIRVFGDRTWCFPSRLSLVPFFSEPQPFQSIDLVYERAFGGIDTTSARYCPENPIGRGFIGNRWPASIHGKPLPNLEDPEALIEAWDSRPRPVGFGFYGRGWMPRLAYAGTYDERYYAERFPKPPLDFLYEFYNAAHPDLQVDGYLEGNEAIDLENLRDENRCRIRLPGITPKITVFTYAEPPERWIERQQEQGYVATLEQIPTVEKAVPSALDTLVILPDEGRLYLIYRGHCPISTLDSPEVALVKVTA